MCARVSVAAYATHTLRKPAMLRVCVRAREREGGVAGAAAYATHTQHTLRIRYESEKEELQEQHAEPPLLPPLTYADVC